MATLTLTADQASALRDGLDYAVPFETDGLAGAVEVRRRFGAHLEIGEHLLTADLEAGGELPIADTAAALRVVRDLIVSCDEEIGDDTRSLLTGPKFAEDQADWNVQWVPQHLKLIAANSRRRERLCEVLAELSLRRSAELEMPSLDDVPKGEIPKWSAAEARKFLGEEEAS